MNKTTKKSFVFLLLGILSIGFFISNTTNAEKEIDGEALSLKIAAVIGQNKELLEDKTIVGEINGEPLYKGEILLRKKIYDVENGSSSSHYKAALESIIQEKSEDILARELGISVSQEEILQDIERDQYITYSVYNDEQLEFFRQYVSELGLTEEAYWNEYRPNEVLRYYTHKKIQHYFENNPTSKNLMNFDYEITDEEIKSLINN